jgi:DNA (cytosine-5)-methyltransferase 1
VTYASVCSGIEATTLAWEPSGFRPAWFAEIDPFCSALLAHRYPGIPNLGDFRNIEARAGAIDILAGGTPCQSFSVAGRRRGLDDPRGNLAIEFCRIAGRLRPRWIVWENVPGVLSSNGGQDFAAILGALAELGYGCAWRVLDAQFFGVPQRRRRVFVVGHLGDWRRAAAVLLERESLCRDTPSRGKARQSVAALTADGVGTCGADDNQAQAGHLIPFGGNNGAGPIDVATACNAHGGAGRIDFETETFCVAFRGFGQDGFAPREIAPPVLASDGGTVGPPVVFESRFARNGRGAPGEIAPPLKAQSGGSGRGDGAPLVAMSLAVRRLTPRECERLQGLPDDYTLIPNYRRRLNAAEVEEMARYLGIPVEEARRLGATPDGPRYKAIGNSMAVPVMRWIGRRLQAVDRL